VTEWWKVKPSISTKQTPPASSTPTPATTPSTPVIPVSQSLPADPPSEDELNLMPGNFVGAATTALLDPKTLAEALECWDGAQWLDASKEEIENHIRNKTWDLVKAPEGAIVIGSGWVFRVKRKSDGSVEHYKARFVAKGYSQRPGYDFFETFAPTF